MAQFENKDYLPPEAPEKSTLEGLLDGGLAGVEGAADVIPGALGAAAELGHYLTGNSVQSFAQAQEQRRHEYPIAHGAGTLAGIGGMMALAAPAAGAAAGAGALGWLGTAASGAGAGAAMAAASRLSEAFHQTQVENTPLSIEQIKQAFDPGELIKAALLSSGIGVAAKGLGLGLEVAEGKLQGRAAAKAVTEAEKVVGPAAESIAVPPTPVAQRALKEGWLDSSGAKTVETRYHQAMRSASEAVDEAVSSNGPHLAASDALNKLARDADLLNDTLAAPMARVTRDAATLANDNSKNLKTVADLAGGYLNRLRAATNPTERQFWAAAEGKLRGIINEALEGSQNPFAGQQYRQHAADARLYATMNRELVDAPAQASVRSVLTENVALPAVTSALGGLFGGVPGALKGAATGAALDVLGLSAKKVPRNYAVLLDQLARAEGPAARFNTYLTKHIDNLMSGAAVTGAQWASGDLHAEYDDKRDAIERIAADPEAAAELLRKNVGFLPPQVADSFTAKTVDDLMCLAHEVPKNPLPPTMFSQDSWNPTDGAKRQWLGKYTATFDPLAGISHGDPAVRGYAEMRNPESVNELKQQVLRRIADAPGISYTLKQKLGRMYGVAALPSQDGAVGGRLQQMWQADSQQQQDPGHAGTATQAKSKVNVEKAARGWATRAQQITLDSDKK